MVGLSGDHTLIDQVEEGLRDQGIERAARAVANFPVWGSVSTRQRYLTEFELSVISEYAAQRQFPFSKKNLSSSNAGCNWSSQVAAGSNFAKNGR